MTRQHLEIICREAFKKFKTWLTIKGVNTCRHALDASNIIYKALQENVEKADFSDIMHALHEIIIKFVDATEVRKARKI